MTLTITLEAATKLWYAPSIVLDLSSLFKVNHVVKAVFNMHIRSYPHHSSIKVLPIAFCRIEDEYGARALKIEEIYWYNAKSREQALRALYMKILLNQHVTKNDLFVYYTVVKYTTHAQKLITEEADRLRKNPISGDRP